MTVLSLMTIPLTVTSDDMEPIEIPWPPEQVFPVKTMLDPLLMARQSSWFLTVEFWIVCKKKIRHDPQQHYIIGLTRSVVDTSKPSVLWPAGSPSLLSFGSSPCAAEDINRDESHMFWQRTIIYIDTNNDKRSGVRDAERLSRRIDDIDVRESSRDFNSEVKSRDASMREFL